MLHVDRLEGGKFSEISRDQYSVAFFSNIQKLLMVHSVNNNDAYGFVLSPNGILQFYFLYDKLPSKEFFLNNVGVYFLLNLKTNLDSISHSVQKFSLHNSVYSSKVNVYISNSIREAVNFEFSSNLPMLDLSESNDRKRSAEREIDNAEVKRFNTAKGNIEIHFSNIYSKSVKKNKEYDLSWDSKLIEKFQKNVFPFNFKLSPITICIIL